jgi:hypothetical protein
LIVRDAEAAGTNLCTTFHPVRYVTDVLASGWEVASVVEEGATGNSFQDVFLLRRPYHSGETV